jgi:hypothetical protein
VQSLQDFSIDAKTELPGVVEWSPEAALVKLKQALTSTHCLGLPDHTKTFNLFIS